MAEMIGLAANFDVNQFNRGLSQYVAGLEKADSKTEQASKTINRMGLVWDESANRWRNASGQFASNAEMVAAGVKKTGNATDDAGKKAKGATDSFSKFGHTLSTALGTAIGNIATATLGAITRGIENTGRAILGLGQESLTMATDFQSSMSVLSIAAKSTGLAYDQLHDAAITVGGDADLVGVSASGAAESMTGLFKAGLTGVEVFGDLQGYMAGTAELGGALRASIDLAAATELDMVRASDLAAVALSTFGSELKTEEERANFINVAMDNFVKAADASVAEVSDLAAALANVGPVANAMGLSIQDTNNALAILSTRGISGAEAGTNLKSMLNNMIRPTNAVRGALKDLNILTFVIVCVLIF